MNRIYVAVCAASLSIASADIKAQEESAGPVFSPVEVMTCNYKDGKGPADMDKAVDAWNKFLDKNDVTTYFGVTLHPQYFGPDSFDVAWLGAWTNGEAMGSGTDFWLENGAEYSAKFAAVVDCDSHSNFATTMIKEPPGDGPPDNMVLTFTDCSVKDGITFGEVYEALGAWSEYQESMDYNNGQWMMFPAFGGGDVEYDFKLVSSFENHTAVGKVYDKYGNDGGYQKYGELVGSLMECNVDRVYNARVRRKMPEENQ